VLLLERLDRTEPRDGPVVDEDVHRTELALGLLHDPGPVLGAGQVGGDRHGGAAGVEDRLHRFVDGSLEHALTGFGRARRDGDACPLGGEAPGDLGADPAAGTRHDGNTSVE
jgi:hypothetical protein